MEDAKEKIPVWVLCTLISSCRKVVCNLLVLDYLGVNLLQTELAPLRASDSRNRTLVYELLLLRQNLGQEGLLAEVVWRKEDAH